MALKTRKNAKGATKTWAPGIGVTAKAKKKDGTPKPRRVYANVKYKGWTTISYDLLADLLDGMDVSKIPAKSGLGQAIDAMNEATDAIDNEDTVRAMLAAEGCDENGMPLKKKTVKPSAVEEDDEDDDDAPKSTGLKSGASAVDTDEDLDDEDE